MNKLGLITLLLAVSTLAVAADNGNGNTATATITPTISITVVTPIKVSQVADLSFGSLVVKKDSFRPGHLIVGADGSLDTTGLGGGTWEFQGSNHQKPQAAKFAVTGETGYEFGFAAGEFQLLHAEGDILKVAPLFSTVGMTTSGTVPKTVNVGGRLDLLAFPKTGVWTGTIIATAIYL
jgi:hypothetical protein